MDAKTQETTNQDPVTRQNNVETEIDVDAHNQKEDTCEKQMNEYAAEHKGKCFADNTTTQTTLENWECENGHRFEMKYAEMKAGKWCTICETTTHVESGMTVRTAKDRALALLKQGQPQNAVISMLSDYKKMGKFKGEKNEPTKLMLLMAVKNTALVTKEFIEGFA